MRIKTSYAEMVKALGLVSKMVSVKGLQDDMRVLNIEVVDGVIRAVATDGLNFCMYTIEGEADKDVPLFSVYVKELIGILDKYKSLQRTEVESVEMFLNEQNVVMRVAEKAKEGVERAELYNQGTEYIMVRERPKKLVTDEIPLISLGEESKSVPMENLSIYIDYLQPLVNIPKFPDLVHFMQDKVYAVLGSVYGVEMPNTLTEEFRDISLSPATLNMLKEITGKGEEFKVSRETVKGRDGEISGVVLTLAVGEYCFRIKVSNKTGNTRISVFTDMPDTAVKVDKVYLLDSLKRVQDAEVLYIELDLDKSVMCMRTEKVTQQIPIMDESGAGRYVFAVSPKHLVNVVFSHINKTRDGERVEDVEIGVRESQDKRTVEITCKDRTDTWMTKYPRAPVREMAKRG